MEETIEGGFIQQFLILVYIFHSHFENLHHSEACYGFLVICIYPTQPLTLLCWGSTCYINDSYSIPLEIVQKPAHNCIFQQRRVEIYLPFSSIMMCINLFSSYAILFLLNDISYFFPFSSTFYLFNIITRNFPGPDPDPDPGLFCPKQYDLLCE